MDHHENLYLSFFISVMLAFPAMKQQTFIDAGYLFDGTTGHLTQNKTIVVEYGRIVSVRDVFQRPASGAELIDLTGMTVLPGLIDLHVHLEGETNPNRYVETIIMNPEDRALRSVIFAR